MDDLGKLDLASSPVASAFMQSNARRRVIKGPFGSGKSTACVFEVPRRGLLQAISAAGVRKTRFAVVRNTVPQLRDTTMKTWFDWFPNGSIGYYKETGKTYYIKADGLDCEVMFRALDDASDIKNLLSLELTGAWLNECREIPQEIVDALDGRIGRYPSKRDGWPSWLGIWADTNPPEMDSYWYRLMENLDVSTGERVDDNGWEAFHQPSGLSEHAENKKNLVPGYYENLAQGKDKEFVKMYVHGEYGTTKSGKPVHPLFDREIHVAKSFLTPNPKIPIVVSADFGLTPAITIKQQDTFGRVLTLDEIVTERMGLQRCIRLKLRPLLKSKYTNHRLILTGDPAGMSGAQTDERTCKDIFREEGYKNFTPAYSNNPIYRYGATDGFLSMLTEQGPAYLIDPRCKYLVRALDGGYHYKVTKQGIQSTSPEKNIYSHIAEASHYGDMWFEKGPSTAEAEEERKRLLAAQQKMKRSYTRR